jgi:hypothetical protein
MTRFRLSCQNHTVLTRKLQAYLRWRNANARHPDVLTAQRRERARIRSEKNTAGDGPPGRPINPANVRGHCTWQGLAIAINIKAMSNSFGSGAGDA